MLDGGPEPPPPPEPVQSEAAAAVAARREQTAGGCCAALRRRLCGCVLALSTVLGTALVTAAVAGGGGPWLLACLLTFATGASAWLTWRVLPAISGFAMRLAAATTFLGFVITCGMLVLLPIDVATHGVNETTESVPGLHVSCHGIAWDLGLHSSQDASDIVADRA